MQKKRKIGLLLFFLVIITISNGGGAYRKNNSQQVSNIQQIFGENPTHSKSEKYLNRYQLLYIFYAGTSSGTLQENSAPLTISNLEKTDILYSVLQQARDTGSFPNYQGELPKLQTATHEHLSWLLHHKYGTAIQKGANTPLTFDTLQKQLHPHRSHHTAQSYLPEQTQTKIKEIDQKVVLEQISEILEYDSYYSEENKQAKAGLGFPSSLSGMNEYLKHLPDPYANYYTPSEATTLINSLESKLSGIGAVLSLNEERIPVVTKVLDNSPAQHAGIQVGDAILAVDGEKWEKDQDFNLFISKIRGEAGSETILKILRSGTSLHFKLKRATLKIPVINGIKQEEKCLIKLTSFDLDSSKDFFSQAKKLNPCKTWIFDLRGNPGGIVDEVLKIINAFVPAGKKILRFEGKNHQETYYAMQSDFSFGNEKVQIIIDKNSASAAEIFAGVLKLYLPGNVEIIGERSFGKGSVQSLVELIDHSLLKYTIALWYIADQTSSIERIGIHPDITLSDNPETPTDEILIYLGLTPQ